MCDLETIDTPSMFSVIRRVVTFVVYYESLKGELQTKPIKECRCDERLQPRVEESTRLICPRPLLIRGLPVLLTTRRTLVT